MGPAGKCHFGISTLSATCTTPLDCMTSASARVRMGLIPLEMQEKCFLYYAGETLHLHRSWTGSRIARVHFAPDGDGLRATSAEVNREPQQYTATDDAADIDHRAVGTRAGGFPTVSRRAAYCDLRSLILCSGRHA